jgi:signal transduction histidine kinase
MGWVFEQLEMSFDHSRAYVLPVSFEGSVKGALILQSDDIAKQYSACDFEGVFEILARMLNFARITRSHADLSEKFAMAVSSLESTSRELTKSASFEAVAEIAAGAAHELNNPLSIISGRVQLLKESIQDQTRANDLEQIRQKAQDISDIITDLMEFARPQTPAKNQVSTAVLIDEALVRLSERGLDTQKVTVKDDSMENVTVDREQIITAISNVLENAIEAVTLNGTGVTVTETSLTESTQAQISISDDAEGMEAEIVDNATMPFFSSKPAGRKRGMGLAKARRYIEKNNGSLTIQSSPKAGTTVIIKLPT